MINEKITMKVISAEKFFGAKVLEYEAACFVNDDQRIKAAEENCHSALQGVLDTKLEQTRIQINEFRRNNK